MSIDLENNPLEIKLPEGMPFDHICVDFKGDKFSIILDDEYCISKKGTISKNPKDMGYFGANKQFPTMFARIGSLITAILEDKFKYEIQEDYECLSCNKINDLSAFEHTIIDNDALGTCPECNEKGIIVPVVSV